MAKYFYSVIMNSMKKSLIFTGVSLLALLIGGCNLLPMPSAPTGVSSSDPSKTTLTTVNPSTPTTQTTESSDTSDPTTVPTSTTTTPIPTSSTTTPPTSSSTSPSTGPTTGPSTGSSSSSSTSTSSTPPGPYVPDYPENYYSTCEGLSGQALINKLYDINQPQVKDYSWQRDEDADEALDDPTSVLCLYTRHNIPKANHVGSYAWDTWNKEHIWPQGTWNDSRTDTHNYFACEGLINNYRGSKKFAEGGERITVHNHLTDCYQTGSTFEPCDDAKGEVIRAVMYGAVMYKNNRELTDMIESVEMALKWHLEHPVNQREIRRNNVVYDSDQKNRNPFADHPEYACRIWGSTNSTTKQLCGMN